MPEASNDSQEHGAASSTGEGKRPEPHRQERPAHPDELFHEDQATEVAKPPFANGKHVTKD